MRKIALAALLVFISAGANTGLGFISHIREKNPNVLHAAQPRIFFYSLCSEKQFGCPNYFSKPYKPASSAVVNPAPIKACTTIARPALNLIVKNERGQELYRGSDLDARQRTWLKITSNGNLYTVILNRRWYKTQTIQDIKVKYDDCGPAVPTRVVARLTPLPDAPTIREFRIQNANADDVMVVGYWPYFQRYTTFLDAPGSVSREVIWTSSRPDVATVDSGGMLRAVCGLEAGLTRITATLKVNPKYTSNTAFGRSKGTMVCKRGAVDR